MLVFVIVLHVLVCLVLMGVILIQPGNKGGANAALGGGGGQTVFGGRGANTFLAKLTAWAAVVFMLTNFSLVYFSSKSGSAFDNVKTPAPAAKPADDVKPTQAIATEKTIANDNVAVPAAAAASDVPAPAEPSGDDDSVPAKEIAAPTQPAAEPVQAPTPAAAVVKTK